MAFLLVGAVTGGPLIYLSFKYAQNLTERSAQQQAVQQVGIIANNFMQQFGENVRRSLEHSVSSDVYREYISTSPDQRIVVRKKLENSFMRMIKAYDEFSGMYYIDAVGSVEISIEADRRDTMARTLVGEMAETAGETATPTRANLARLFGRMKDIPVLLSSGNMEWFIPPRVAHTEGPYIDENGRLSVLVGLATMDFDNGAFGGVIVIRQRLDTLAGQLKSVRFFEKNPVWLFDAEHRVLLKPEQLPNAFDPRPYLGEESVRGVEYRSLAEGVVAHAGLPIVPGTPIMHVAFAIPKSLLMKDFESTLQIFLVVLLCSMAVMLSLAFVISKRIAKPIVKLADAASRLARGDLSARVDVETSGEIQVLVDSFNQMTASLQSADAELKVSAENLRTALQREKQLNKLQRQFISMASHEFRTPMAIIDLTAQRLRRNAERLTPEKIIDRLDKIRDAVKQMTQLMESTLSAARLEDCNIKLDPRPCNVKNIIMDVCDQQREISPKVKINFQFKDLPNHIVADRVALERIFTNLLFNAIKYSPGTPRIEIRARGMGDTLTVTVRDFGLGIDEDDLPNMFQRFFRAKTSTGIAGTGIGLHLVANLVELHGGSVSVDSRKGEGSTFTVHLPVSGKMAAGATLRAA